MAIVFKDAKIERKPLIKDAESGTPTTFWFEVTPALRRQAFLNAMGGKGFDNGDFMNEVFRKALVGWEGLKDEKGAEIPFNETIRDLLVSNTETFTAIDVIEMFNIPKEMNEPEQSTKKKNSTSKKH